jgi:hypothetical protein
MKCQGLLASNCIEFHARIGNAAYQTWPHGRKLRSRFILAQLYQLAHSNSDFKGVLARKSESDQRRPIANRL